MGRRSVQRLFAAERVWIDGAEMYDMHNPKKRPVSDFELGQPGEGDVK